MAFQGCAAHVWLFALTLLLTSTVRAQDAGPPLSLEARSVALEAALKDVQRPTRMYFGGWLTALSLMAVGQAGLALIVDDPARRASFFLGAGLSTAGVGLMLITPFPGRYGAEELARMPTGTDAEKRAKVERGETLLEKEADSAWFQRAWFQHLFTTALGGGVMLGLALLYPDDVWTVAVPTGLGTFLTAEAQIWTRPKAAIGHWDRYERQKTQLSVSPLVAPETLGLGLSGRF